MANKLMDMFRFAMQSSKKMSEEAKFDVMYSTGFLNVDYSNGTVVHVRTPELTMDYNSLGIVDGTSNTIISRPGAGKSTLIAQWLGYLLKTNPGSVAYIDDIESSLPTVRKEYLFGLPKEEVDERVYIRNIGITTESVYEQLRTIHDLKVNNPKEYEYDTGLYDTAGNRIFKLIPTFYFIDSFAMLLPNDINDETEMEGGKNDAMSMAKKSTVFIKKIAQLLKGANIVLFTINHIMDNPQMGPFVKASQVEGLKPDERLPGGKTSLYLANNLFRMDKAKSLKESEAFGIPGTVINFTICKSRTNANMRSVPLIFDKSRGLFDNVLSTFYYLKDEGYVGGAGRGMYFVNYPDLKFSQKEFKSKCMENPELAQAFAITAKEALTKLLSDTSAEAAIQGELDLNTMVFNLAA